MPLPTTANTTSPKAAGLDILIESNYFQLAAQPERPFDLQEAAGEIRAANEFITNPEDLTARESSPLLSQVDFSGGEGLDFAHRPDNTDFDKTRFWQSEGIEVIDPPGQVSKLQLANQFQAFYTTDDLSTYYGTSSQMTTAGGSLFSIDNSMAPQRVIRWDDPLNSTVNTGEDPFAGEAANDLLSICTMNGEVYVSITGDGVHRRDSTGTWTHLAGQNPRRLWGLKGHLLGAYLDRELREYTASGSSVLLSLPVGEGFRAACDAGAAILVGTTTGVVYALAEVDGSLTLRAQTPFPSEEITGLGAGPAGMVLVGTRSQGPDGLKGRLYMGELGSSYTIQNAQLLREWDLNSNLYGSAPSFITFDRDRAYFGVVGTSGGDELWQFDAATTGIFLLESRDMLNTDLAGISIVDGRPFLIGRDRDILRQETTYQPSGYLISPLFDHFDAEDKVWAAAKFFGVNFPTGTSATLYYSTNPDAIENSAHASWTSIKTLDATTGVDDSEALIAGAESRWITLKMELATSAAASTPQIRGYSVRAYAGPGDITLRIPINVSDYVLRPGRQAVRINGFGKTRYDQLKSYEGTAVTLQWLYTGETFEGTIKSIGTRVPLKPRRGSPLLISQVEFVGRRS